MAIGLPIFQLYATVLIYFIILVQFSPTLSDAEPGVRNQESGIIYSRKCTIHAIYKGMHTVQGSMKLYSLMWPEDFH